MKNICAAFLLLFLPMIVFADQAAYVTKEEAARAFALLENHAQIKHHCALCDDKSVTAENIETIEFVETGYENTWEVLVNGKGIDLAYVYFKTDKGKWKNVAEELDIEVDGVPKFLPADE